VRSERQLLEQLDFNLLFRWFVGLGIDAPVWHATVFTKNRDRLLAGDVAEALLAGVLRQADSTFNPPPLPDPVRIVDLEVGPHRPIAGLDRSVLTSRQ
jgi:hypothetical protein